MIPDDNVNNTSPYRKSIEQAARNENLFNQILDELNASEKVKQLREVYSESSVDSFVTGYARQKVSIFEYADYYVKHREREELQWFDRASMALEEIQQKKLFDLQCLWRAEKIHIDEVKITLDFQLWEDDILNCPFVPPVSQEEVDLYIEYLKSNNYEDTEFGFFSWQEYDEIKEAYQNEDEDMVFPEWYDFYNCRMGTTVYMSFSDVKSDKENFYISIYDEHNSPKETLHVTVQQVNHESQDKEDERLPWLNMHDEDELEWFVRHFEDIKTRRFAYACDAFSNKENYNISWDALIVALVDILEPAPVPSGYHWRDALEVANQLHIRKKTIEAMPLAFESYIMRLKAGIPFENQERKAFETHSLKQFRDKSIQKIVQGRILNGEPPDLDY